MARAGFQLASALAYLHGRAPQLLHRDIKPANLLLAAAPGADLPPPGPLSPEQASALVCGGTLLLGDFGSALALSRTLATGTVSGTPAYKASEILNEEEYAAPADVWSYGATLLQLGTGHVAGGTGAARRAIMANRGNPWSLQQALAGAYHDKLASAEEEEAWGADCAAQRAAWEGLGAPLQQLIESCLVVDAEGRARTSELLGHTAFEKQRRAALVTAAVAKLTPGAAEGGGAGADISAAELLAVLEASPMAALQASIFERACASALSQCAAADMDLGGLAAALLGAARIEAFAGPAVCALKALHDKGGGEAAAVESTSGCVGSLLAAAASLAAEIACLKAGGAA